MDPLYIVLPLISATVVGCICWFIARNRSFKKGYNTRKVEAEAIFGSAEAEGKRIVSEAVKEGEAKKREFLLLAKEEIHKSRIELEREIKDRRSELQRSERRLIQKEESLDKKQESLEAKEAVAATKIAEAAKYEEEIKNTLDKQIEELQRIAGMSKEEAKALLLSNVEQELQHETVMLVKEFEQKCKDESNEKAREIIG